MYHVSYSKISSQLAERTCLSSNIITILINPRYPVITVDPPFQSDQVILSFSSSLSLNIQLQFIPSGNEISSRTLELLFLMFILVYISGKLQARVGSLLNEV